MTEGHPARKHACPRCHSGFLVFDGTVGGDNGVCINCGFREPMLVEVPIFSRGQPRMPRGASEPLMPGKSAN